MPAGYKAMKRQQAYSIRNAEVSSTVMLRSLVIRALDNGRLAKLQPATISYRERGTITSIGYVPVQQAATCRYLYSFPSLTVPYSELDALRAERRLLHIFSKKAGEYRGHETLEHVSLVQQACRLLRPCCLAVI